MSVSKFLKRIVTAEIEEDQLVGITDDIHLAKKIASHLHEYTHGINSDPITLFAIVFSAVIHDVDHRGVSNTQLMKEEPNMAQMFRNKSIAEQNSLELSWDLLVSDRFAPLRNFIFATGEEMLRFRQVVVNVVLATGKESTLSHMLAPSIASATPTTPFLTHASFFFSSSTMYCVFFPNTRHL